MTLAGSRRRVVCRRCREATVVVVTVSCRAVEVRKFNGNSGAAGLPMVEVSACVDLVVGGAGRGAWQDRARLSGGGCLVGLPLVEVVEVSSRMR